MARRRPPSLRRRKIATFFAKKEEKTLRQTKKSKIKHRYAIFVSEEYGTIRQKEHAVFLPLWYFLLL